MRHLVRPLRIGCSGHSEGSGAVYSRGAHRRGSAHTPNQGIYGRHHPHHEQKAGDAKNYKQSKRPAQVVQNGVQAREVQKPRPNKIQTSRKCVLLCGRPKNSYRIGKTREKLRKDIRRIFVRQKKTGGNRQEAVQGRDGCNRQSPVARKIQGVAIAARATAKTPVASHHL